jgi:glycosyltransferase involved in cell wall biosynthesis
MKVIFIVPSYNIEKNFLKLTNSLLSQKSERWSCIIIDDISQDDTAQCAAQLMGDNRFYAIKNVEKKYALRNVVESARLFQEREDVVIAVVDGDDQLCNDETVSLLLDRYEKGDDVVWTAHVWDINNLNISKPIPKNVDPYSWPWCSSHLRTFKASLLRDIPDSNFKNTKGEWFKRGYDQALMLPLLKKSKSRNYIDKVCYQYNIESVSMPERSWEEMDQISTINLVRARGFMDE